MEKELLIAEKFGEIQIALIENGKLSEFYIENPLEKNIIGNIYKCKINKVIEGISACFVELDDEDNAHLYSKDISIKAALVSNIINENIYKLFKNNNSNKSILNYLKAGQNIIVQGKRNSSGKKHPKVTCKITIPGKYIVFLPFHSSIAISKKIKDPTTRKSLRELAKSICPNAGLILRTSSAKVDKELIINEIEKLKKLWDDILKSFLNPKSKGLLYKAPPLRHELLIDLHHETELKKIKVSSLDIYNDIVNFCSQNLPILKNKISLHLNEDLFEAYRVYDELDKALQPQIWLKSGSYIVFNHTEALTSIDVNTGKSNSRKKAELNMLSINLEAVNEICRQIRIRNIGGIIIIDFLPMASPNQFNELFEKLKNELSKDKAKIRVSKDDNASLAIIIRKKMRESLLANLSIKCPYCKGLGIIKSNKLICNQIINQIISKSKFNRTLTITAHPSIISSLSNLYSSILNELKLKNKLSLNLVSNTKYHLNKFNIE